MNPWRTVVVASIIVLATASGGLAASMGKPPDTRITGKPAPLTRSATAVFGFRATKPRSRFSCRLDDARFKACANPKRYSALADGSHAFRVRAADQSGRVDGTPAAYHWTIDTSPPETIVTAHPASLTEETTATFSFAASEKSGSFECSLDGVASEICSSPKTYTGLSVARHSFQVRATDRAGNQDPTPATYSWTVAHPTPPPPPPPPPVSKPVNTTLPNISGTATEGQSLSASPGSWQNAPRSYTYQWQRCDSGSLSCSNITGAVLSTYALGLADIASTIRVVVTASNAYGEATASSHPGSVVSFNYEKELSGPAVTLVVQLQSTDLVQGSVTINGFDARAPTTPFSFSWGDGAASQGFFPQTHTYFDRSRNYLVRVTAHYSQTQADFADVPVRFVPAAPKPVFFPDSLAVTIPDHPVTLGTTYPPYGAPTLSYFGDSFFTTAQPRASAEYVFSQAANVDDGILEGDHALIDAAFREVVLRAQGFGGASSLWFTTPVAIGSGETFFTGTIGYSSMFHEMGHNFTLNSPAAFRYGGKIDGSANAIVSESLAQMFQHTTAYQLVNNANSYGIPSDLAVDIASSAESSMTTLRSAYDSYVMGGKPFATWNDPATGGDETFGTFMTVAYVFARHAEATDEYAQPLRRAMRLLRTFNGSMLAQYAPGSNTQAASTFRSTLLVAALSYGFAEDLRGEFRDLGFPVDDSTYRSLYESVP